MKSALFSDGDPTHRLLVPAYDGQQREPGDLVAYEGKPSWKFEPLDPAAHEAWAKEHGNDERVSLELLRTRRQGFGAL